MKGFTLLGAVVAFAILSTLVYLLMGNLADNAKIMASLDKKSDFEQVDAAVRGAVRRLAFHQMRPNFRCDLTVEQFDALWAAEPGDALKLSPIHADAASALPKPLAARCSGQSVGKPIGSGFYYCARLSEETNRPVSWLQANEAVVEVSIQLHDAKRGTSTTCAKFANHDLELLGGRIYYQLHWWKKKDPSAVRQFKGNGYVSVYP